LGKAGTPPKYNEPKELFEDLNLIWSNARTFNPADHWVTKQANVMDEASKKMWLNSSIQQRWAEMHGEEAPSLSEVRVSVANRKRRRPSSGPGLASEADHKIILEALQGSWQCKPAAFGKLTIRGEEGTYANGAGRLSGFKVLKSKSVVANWTRRDLSNKSSGTLQFRVAQNALSWKGHWQAAKGKPFGIWSAVRISDEPEDKGNEGRRKEKSYTGWKPKKNSMDYTVLRVMYDNLFDGENKVAKAVVVEQSIDAEIVSEEKRRRVLDAIDRLVNKHQMLKQTTRRKGQVLELLELGRKCCAHIFKSNSRASKRSKYVQEEEEEEPTDEEGLKEDDGNEWVPGKGR